MVVRLYKPPKQKSRSNGRGKDDAEPASHAGPACVTQSQLLRYKPQEQCTKEYMVYEMELDSNSSGWGVVGKKRWD